MDKHYLRTMSRNNTQLYYHLIFGTKHRENSIPEPIHSKLYGCIWKKCEDLSIIPIAINGTQNHIHILFKSNTTTTLASIVNGIKGLSSRWLNATMEPLKPFRWQRGYGLFTVSSKDLDMIINYIKKQKEHHSNGSVEPKWENES